MEKVNISEVAKRAGVSKATVSNYLNNRTHKLSDTTREKLKLVIAELNYTPYIGAQRLSLKQPAKTIGIILERTTLDKSSSMFFFVNISASINKVLEKEGYKVIIIPDQNLKSGGMMKFIRGFSYGMVDGFLLLNIQENDDYITELQKLQTPFVCFGKTNIEGVSTYVATDHSKGIAQATAFFLDQGIQDVYISIASRSSVVSRQYESGYVQAMEVAGQKVIPEKILGRGAIEDVSLFEEFLDILKNADKPVAFVLPHIQLRGLLDAIRVSGKQMNKDVVFIVHSYFSSFDDTGDIAYLKSPIETLGITATYMLMDLIRNKHSEEHKEVDKPVLFELELINGRSAVLHK